MFKWYERFNDELFNNYNSSGEATAVHIVRDRAFDINTTGKWIDIIDTHMYKHPRYNKLGFSWIIAELFPRITKPEYTDDDYMNRYLCWQAAHNYFHLYSWLNDISQTGGSNYKKGSVPALLIRFLSLICPLQILSDKRKLFRLLSDVQPFIT